MMETTVISLGGSLIVPAEIDVSFLKRFREIMLLYCEKNRAVIVCGGGMVCRLYQHAAKAISDVPDADLDWIGIRATKLNAELVRAMFGTLAHDKVTDDPLEKIKTDKRIIIGSGFVPGASSDNDAVLLAKNFGANRVINLSNVDHVYDKDPRFFPDAKMFDRMSWEEYTKICGDTWKPGANLPFDPTASKNAKKHGIKVLIMNGRDLKNFTEALHGRKFKGTLIG
jgi:uridylate kinase